MFSSVVDDNITNCRSCNLCSLAVNESSVERGYGKLLPKRGRDTNGIMIVGLNPSKNRFPDLIYPFGGGKYFNQIKYALLKSGAL